MQIQLKRIVIIHFLTVLFFRYEKPTRNFDIFLCLPAHFLKTTFRLNAFLFSLKILEFESFKKSYQ